MEELWTVLRRDEEAIFRLRDLYRRYGYRQYKVSRFEAYDLYARNKSFLVSDSVLTFTDTTGRLLALKPDVTLSIIKNTKDGEAALQKLCYNEHVYRAVHDADGFREIMQVGLECIGQVDRYAMGEVVLLAARSLETISPRWVLDLSHLGFLSALLDEITGEAQVRQALLRCIGEKNAHGLEAACRQAGIGEADRSRIQALARLHGPLGESLPALAGLCGSPGARAALEELEALRALLAQGGVEDRVMLDFSILNDMRYYNGVIFQGFVEGIPSGILSGGRYDRLMEKMGKRSQAVGFAVYLDQLERLQPPAADQVDALLLYDEDAAPDRVLRAVQRLAEGGKTVRAERTRPDNVGCRQVWRLEKGGELRLADDT